MANSDKNILITPNKGQSSLPEIKFIGGGNAPLYIKATDSASGELSFQSGISTIFNINTNLSSGSVFTITDEGGNLIFDIEEKGSVTINGDSQSSVNVNKGTLKLPSYDFNNIPAGQEGMLIFDKTNLCPKLYTNKRWINLGGDITPIKNGLVCNLDASNPQSYSGGNIWYDSSSNRNFATHFNGPPSYLTDGAGSLDYDGSNDYSQFTNFNNVPTTEMTLNIWIKPDSTTQRTTLLSRWGASGLGNFSWLLFLNWFSDGNIYFLVGNSAGNSYTSHSIPHSLSTSQWTNFSVVYCQGSIVRMYRNGENLVNSSSGNTSLKSVTTPITIGADFDGGSADTLTRPFNGKIGVVQIYNRSLSDSEIRINFNKYRNRYGVL